MTLKQLAIIAITLMFIIAGLNAYVGLRALARVDTLIQRVSHDEYQTCTIQARGLPAGHQLAASMSDIHILLTLPSPKGSPPVPPQIESVIKSLNQHLSLYLKAEAKQPQQRVCLPPK